MKYGVPSFWARGLPFCDASLAKRAASLRRFRNSLGRRLFRNGWLHVFKGRHPGRIESCYRADNWYSLDEESGAHHVVDRNNLDWDLLESCYEDAGLILFKKRIDRVRNPRNDKVFDRLVLESADWVNVVALDKRRHSVMIRQYRFGVGYTTLETPGGMVDPGEDSKSAAMRELLEETGYESDRWTYLGAVEPNPAFHNHLCHHWLAEDAERTREQDVGSGEMIAVELMSQQSVREAVERGELKHALALSALARVFQIWPLPFRQDYPSIQ